MLTLPRPPCCLARFKGGLLVCISECTLLSRASNSFRGCQRRSKTSALARARGDHLLSPVFESVAVALEDEDVGVVDEAVDHGGNGDSLPQISAQAEKVLLELTIRLALS